jgi:hypothetical protein
MEQKEKEELEAKIKEQLSVNSEELFNIFQSLVNNREIPAAVRVKLKQIITNEDELTNFIYDNLDNDKFLNIIKIFIEGKHDY